MTTDPITRRVADELEIRNIIARIALTTDLGDLDEYASFFADDAHFEMRVEAGQTPLVPPTKGRAGIVAGSKKRRADGVSGPGCHMAHCLQTSTVAVTGDTAKAQTYVIVYKNTDKVPEPVAMKIYRDDYIRTAEGWKLSCRFIDPV
jgi:hypothetical protein